MNFQDQTLNCKDCGAPFVWTAGEQEFYQQKGFTNPPSRCMNCRKAKKNRMNDRGGDRDSRPRQSFNITCANCGKPDTVPFEPRNDRPVLCKDCFRQQRDTR